MDFNHENTSLRKLSANNNSYSTMMQPQNANADLKKTEVAMISEVQIFFNRNKASDETQNIN